MTETIPPIVATIAGSDSGGGAGIQADLKTFEAYQCFGTSVITAITAQNTLGVRAVHPVPIAVVTAQIAALAEDLPPRAVKTGMLATRELVETVARGLTLLGSSAVVIDPVMVASSGDRLLEDDAVSAVGELLLPLAACITPNLDEAEILTGLPVRTPEAMVAAGHALIERGAAAALIKGGHLPGDTVVDVLVTATGDTRYVQPRIATRATHGTGCTLSAAIAAGLAHGRPLAAAVASAREYLRTAISTAPRLGAGNGPVRHAGHRPPE